MTEVSLKKRYMALVIFLILIIQMISSKIGEGIANLFGKIKFDKDQVFFWISLHHVVQLVFILIVIWIVKKKVGITFYLKPKKSLEGINYTILFFVIITIYTIAIFSVGSYMNSIQPISYELNWKNILGSLGFQFFLSGTSEEVLFRAFPIVIMMYAWNQNADGKARIDTRVIVILSALLFGIAHINWGIAPFYISVPWFQVGYAVLLGILYGITFIRSKSILYPIIMHGLSNGIMVGAGYIYWMIRR